MTKIITINYIELFVLKIAASPEEHVNIPKYLIFINFVSQRCIIIYTKNVFLLLSNYDIFLLLFNLHL